MAINNPTEQDYDFVEQPDQDYFCPVSLELLTLPCQTICCGHHISQQAADRLIKEGQHCPMCKEQQFNIQNDKYFTRKVRQLNVYCSHKKSECEWTGELGDLNQHTTSCPKRPWKCPYCPFESTHDIGTTDHAPQCDYQPVPCPNHCQVGTVPLRQVEDHLLTCPLQLVDCEFAEAGCDIRVPRKDLAHHMTKNSQQHLTTATFLNLQLTRDLHRKMEEKDQQINELKTQLAKLDTKVEAEFQKVGIKFQNIDTQLEQLTAKVDAEIVKVKTTAEANRVALYHDILPLRGFTCHKITLTEFDKCQEKGDGLWSSKPFSNFSLEVYTNGWGMIRKTHLSVYLLKHHKPSKTEGTVVFQLLNQLGDHGHFIGRELKFSQKEFGCMEIQFFPLANLGYNEASNTQYLKDNCLKFRLFLKVKVYN